MTDRTEAMREEIARIAAPMMEGGREFDQCPPDRIALRKWNREGMCSINDATQDDALTLADELVFLDGGRVVQQGRPAEVIARPRTPYVAQVVGLNLYAGHALDGSTVHTSWGAVVAAPHEHRGESWVAFAPRAVALYRARPEGSPRNTWEVVVAGVEVSGQAARVRLQPLGMPGVSLASEVTVASVVALGLEPGVRAWATVKAAEVTAYPA